MTKREIVIKAIRHENCSKIPFNIDFTEQELENIVNFYGEKIANELCNGYILFKGYSGDAKELDDKKGFFKDDFGVVWNRTGADKDIGVIDQNVISEPIIGCYSICEPDMDKLSKTYKEVSNEKERFRFGTLGFSLFERAWSLCGIDNVLMNFALEPEFSEWLLNEITEYNLKVLDIALEYDLDGFHFGDDWGQQKGLIMGPNYWRKFIKPCLAKMYAKIKEKGLIVSQHSCGDISEIFDDLIEIGLDVYQTVQPEIYDLNTIKNQYGKNLTFWGCISTQRLLPFATPEEVKEKTKEIMEIMSPNGGFIAAPTHSVPSDVPPKNIMSMYETFKIYG